MKKISKIKGMKNYTVLQLSERIGYSRQRIYQLINQGTIKAKRVGGLGWLIPASQYTRIVNRNGTKYHLFERKPYEYKPCEEPQSDKK